MTVSLSLRNCPKVSTATRERVRRIAAEIGYRPDPEISRLMGRLRQSRRTPGTEVIAMVDLRPRRGMPPHPYDRRVQQGIGARADALGFGLTLFQLAEYDGNLGRLLRVLRARNIAGIIFLPSGQPPVTLPRTLQWEEFSVVSATNLVLAPRFHQVLPNQMGNMLTIVEALQRRGFRRIGAILGEAMEERIRHHYSIALSWHGHRERICVLPGVGSVAENTARITAWLGEHRPEVVIAQEVPEVAKLLPAAGLAVQPKLVSLSDRADGCFSYQDQFPELVGDTAARLLTGMMHNHERGVPENPQITLIDGRYCETAALDPGAT